MIACALIGYGYWGINVANALQKSKEFDLVSIFDTDLDRLNALPPHFKLKRFDNYEQILADSSIQAIFIVTPPQSHFELAKKALKNNKHTFVEKPLTTNLAQSYELYDLAKKYSVNLYCDHIFLHSPAVKYLKTHLSEFGQIVYINARRINLGLFQSSVDVIWDLAIHDLSIIDYLIGLDIKKVSTFKTKYLDYPNDALANINIELNNGVILTINVSWLSPVKVREMIIGGSQKSAIYDETKREKLEIFDSGVVIKEVFDKDSLYKKMVEYNLGTKQIPTLDSTLPLESAILYFANMINPQENLDFDMDFDFKAHTLRVMQALEIISKA